MTSKTRLWWWSVLLLSIILFRVTGCTGGANDGRGVVADPTLEASSNATESHRGSDRQQDQVAKDAATSVVTESVHGETDRFPTPQHTDSRASEEGDVDVDRDRPVVPDGLPPLPEGWVRFGQVRFDGKNKAIEVDGYFNMNQGLLEFFACGPGVKPHETLITLDIDPRHLQVALIALGVKPKGRPKNDYDIGPIDGDRVMILLRWQQTIDGKEVTVTRRAEDVIVNFLAEEVMDHTGFVFTGSAFISTDAEPDPHDPRAADGTPPKATDRGSTDDSTARPAADGKPEMVWAPLVLGQFIAMTHRPYAILDNPVRLPYPDPEYGAYKDNLPPLDREHPTKVTLIIRRPKDGEIDLSIDRMTVKLEPEDPDGEATDDAAGGTDRRTGGGETNTTGGGGD